MKSFIIEGDWHGLKKIDVLLQKDSTECRRVTIDSTLMNRFGVLWTKVKDGETVLGEGHGVEFNLGKMKYKVEVIDDAVLRMYGVVQIVVDCPDGVNGFVVEGVFLDYEVIDIYLQKDRNGLVYQDTTIEWCNPGATLWVTVKDGETILGEGHGTEFNLGEMKYRVEVVDEETLNDRDGVVKIAIEEK